MTERKRKRYLVKRRKAYDKRQKQRHGPHVQVRVRKPRA